MTQIHFHVSFHFSPYKKFKCFYCEKSYKAKRSLLEHIQNIHQDVKNFPCDFCGKRFTQKFAMLRHIKAKHSLNGPLKCTMCLIEIKSKSFLNEHLKYVHGAKPAIYICELCGGESNSLGALNIHHCKKSVKYEGGLCSRVLPVPKRYFPDIECTQLLKNKGKKQTGKWYNSLGPVDRRPDIGSVSLESKTEMSSIPYELEISSLVEI